MPHAATPNGPACRTTSRFETRALSGLERLPGRGLLVTNPPYGVRVGERRDLRDLFASLGRLTRERLPGFGMTLLVPAEPLERATGRVFRELFRTQNGGIPVRALHAEGGDGPAPVDSQTTPL